MKVALVQTELIWENPSENRKQLGEKINHVVDIVDLIVLPEMFTSGFTMNPKKVAETMKGETIQWLKSIAKTRDCAITGSLVIEENGNYYNRLVFVFPDGKIEHYDKRHLFTLAGEEKVYTKGENRLIVAYKGWKICPLICYDLRFPVFSRNNEDYDVLVYVANWPQPRIQAWDALLKARAIENMSYVIGVNRIGNDGNLHPYSGHSQVFDYLGHEMVELLAEDKTIVVTLQKELLISTRKRFGFLSDQDCFTLD
jgi:omega-amidase